MSNTKPTVLFVHGLWHTPIHFRRIRDLIESNGYSTSCPALPSVGQRPPVGLMDDAQCIREELGNLIDHERRTVIVIAHSYGGVVTTQAVDARFAFQSRRTRGLTGGVIRIVYMCAFLLPQGECLRTALTSGSPSYAKLPPYISVDNQGTSMMKDPEHRFYHDLPADEQKRWSAELRRCPVVVQLTPITFTAYMHHPVTYLFCENDQAVPIVAQKTMVDNIETSTGIKIWKESCTAGHSPYLSQPRVVLDVIQRIIRQEYKH